MVSQAAEIRQFKGLIPIVDRKRAAEPYVVDGKNFFVDLNGPVSGLGRTWLFDGLVREPRGWQVLRDGPAIDTFHFTGDSIQRYDVTTRTLYPVYTHTLRTEFWPWTRAVVGSVAYYCNREIGVIKHDYVLGEWEDITGNANMPTTPTAICESAGRLIILGEVAVAWSTIDDGEDLVPSTATGTGFQLLSLLSSNARPMMVLPYSNGFMTYTQAGIMRSEEVDAANPFRHRPFSRDHQILNPWAVQRIGGTDREQHILLTERGFFSTFGDTVPEIWAPLMGEFFHRNLIPNIDTELRTNMTFRIEADFKTGWVLVSVSDDSRSSFYSRAFVYYIPSEEWGVYSRVHHGFGEIGINAGPMAGFHYSVMDVEGSSWCFTFSDSDEGYPETGNYQIDFSLPFDMPPRNFAGIASSEPTIMPSAMTMTFDDISMVDEAGVYNLESEQVRKFSPVVMPDESADETPTEDTVNVMRCAIGSQAALRQVAVAPVASTSAPLLAEITVGPFRLPQETSIDHIAQLTETVVGMLDSGVADEFEDYLEDFLDDSVIEDWLTATGSEDWGQVAGDQTEYTSTWFGTLDGYTTWAANDLTQEVLPLTVSQTGRIRHLAGSCSGSYVLLKFSANNIGESFHLRTLKYNMIDAGQLF